jgi:hypothetical protein
MSINYKALILQQLLIVGIIRTSYIVPDIVSYSYQEVRRLNLEKPKPRIEVCINNTDKLGRIRLNCGFSSESLLKNPIRLERGLDVEVYSGNIKLNGTLDYYYSKKDKEEENKIWVVELKEK